MSATSLSILGFPELFLLELRETWFRQSDRWGAIRNAAADILSDRENAD